MLECAASTGETMPRYFFNTRIGDDLISDSDGEVLRDPDHAWEVARTTVRVLLQAAGAQATLVKATLEVTDASGDIVLEFPFSEALLEDVEDTATRH